MKSNSIFALLLLTLAASGCAKAGVSATQQQNSVANLLGSAIQPPTPGTAYSSRSAIQINSGTKAGYLYSQYLDPALADLKESNMHFNQVLSEGTRTNNSLTIVHKGLNATFQGTKQNTTVSYSYNYPSNTPYFTAQAQLNGSGGNAQVTGDINPPVSIQWSIGSSSTTAPSTTSPSTTSPSTTTTVTLPVIPTIPTATTVTTPSTTSAPAVSTRTVTFTSTGTYSVIQFVESLDGNGNTTSTTFKGTFPGSVQVKGAWSWAPGSIGWYADQTGVKQCFNSSLNDVTCPTSLTDSD